MAISLVGKSLKMGDKAKPKAVDQANHKSTLSQGSVTNHLHKVRQGDSGAVDFLWGRLFSQLHGVAQRQASRGDQVDAEQVALDAFRSGLLRLQAGKADWVEHRGQLWALMYSLVRRKMARKQADEDRFSNNLKLPQDGPEENWEDERDVREEVGHLMAQLPNTLTRQVLLYKIYGFSQQETADALNISVRTVRRKTSLIRDIFSQERGRPG